MSARWFRLDDYYEIVGEQYIFYPHLYARGYRFSAEERATMDGVLGPFLNGQLRVEFVAIVCLITFSFTIVAAGYLITASNEELETILAVPPWVLLAGAAALAGLIVVPILFRLRSKIRRQLDEMGLEASEPPRPDYFIVDGKFSRRRLLSVLLGLGALLVLVETISRAGATQIGP